MTLKQVGILSLLVSLFIVAYGNIAVQENSLNLRDLRWLGPTVAIGLSRDNVVYRSTDTGFSWSDMTASLPHSDVPGNEPAFLYPSPVDSSVVYIRGNGLYCWTSTDKGATWKVLTPGQLFVNLRFHPTKSTWILASMVDLNNLYADTRPLYLSQDLGQTWARVSDGVYQYGWGDAGQQDVPSERFYFIGPDPAASYQRSMYYGDGANDKQLLVSGAYVFIFMDQEIFAAVYLKDRNQVVLKICGAIGIPIKSFYEASLPYGTDLAANGYRIIDDYTGAVYLGVVHTSLSAKNEWGNVYLSDSSGIRYDSSLDHVATNYPLFDFDRVQSIEGIYLSNTVENWQDDSADPMLRTLGTFDNGGEWKPLNPPHFDSQGDRIVCTGRCSLHLHVETGLYNNIGPLYSTDKSVGLVIGVGNVGEYLNYDTDQLSTYLSRDGGLTWIEVMKGNTIYEIGDHGGIIVLAPLDTPTNKLYYTTDGGATVQTYTIPDTAPISVFNIITEPTSTGTKFILLGYRDVNITTRLPVMISLDFSGIFSRTCDPDSNDYELFAPTDGHDHQGGLYCLLGHEIKYQRKLATADCWNPSDLEPIKSFKNCTCVEDDWECDFDFERDTNQNCVLVPNAVINEPPVYCPEEAIYFKTQGYQKVAGDTCQGGVDHSPLGPFNCPAGNHPVLKNNLWIIAAVLVPVILVAGCVAFAVVLVKNEKIREKFPAFKFLSNFKIGYSQVNQGPDTLMDDDDDDSVVVQHSKPMEEDEEHGNIFDDKKPIVTTNDHKVEDLIKIDNHDQKDDDNFDPRK